MSEKERLAREEHLAQMEAVLNKVPEHSSWHQKAAAWVQQLKDSIMKMDWDDFMCLVHYWRDHFLPQAPVA